MKALFISCFVFMYLVIGGISVNTYDSHQLCKPENKRVSGVPALFLWPVLVVKVGE